MLRRTIMRIITVSTHDLKKANQGTMAVRRTTQPAILIIAFKTRAGIINIMRRTLMLVRRRVLPIRTRRSNTVVTVVARLIS